jgi:hypothetical protein
MIRKYAPLRIVLRKSTADEISLSFGEIESLIKAPLPPTAESALWWRRRTAGNQQGQAQAWLSEGYEARPDIGNRRVTFVRRPQQFLADYYARVKS